MIKQEIIYREDGVTLVRTYSTRNHYIEQMETGIRFEEAIDLENTGFTYRETNDKFEVPEDLFYGGVEE